MNTQGIHSSSKVSPVNRVVVVLTTLPQQHSQFRSESRNAFTANSKLRIIPSTQYAPRIHSRPTPSASPSLKEHLNLLKQNPSLGGLFRDNVHVKRLSTPNPIRKRLPLQMKKAIINWVTNKKKALLTSVLASSDTLYGFLDKELNLSMQDVERQKPPPAHSPVNVLGLKVNRSTESLVREKKKQGPKTDRNAKARKSLPGQFPKTFIKPLEKATFKEACRDREWTNKAKEQLGKDWARYLRSSNGVTVESPSEAYFAYRYYLGKGNNHPLVKACFKTRQHWVRVTAEEEQETLNLVWTQSKIKHLFKTYPEAFPNFSLDTVSKPVSIACSIKIFQKNAIGTKGKAVDIKPLGYDLITQSPSFVQISPYLNLKAQDLRTHNKLEHNYHLTNKKTLFISMRTYYELIGKDPFEVVPVTFHIKEGMNDPEFQRFLEVYTSLNRSQVDDSEDVFSKPLKNIWIIKPGENTNRGTGITVCSSLDQIKAEISSYAICSVTGQKRTFILQKYIENPLLINKRKFDIRCYALGTCINGIVQGYFYQEGYLRTSCKEFSLKDVGNRYIHLTNDAVQKHSEDYGKYEAGNKMSYSDFQRYLDTHCTGTNVQRDIISQIREIVKSTFLASFAKINAGNRQFSFEILGYDFMVDAGMKVWLIEVNTNPCLEMSSPLLARLIPAMLDNACRIAIDPYFPEPNVGGNRRTGLSLTGEAIPENRFELIFSSLIDGAMLRSQLLDRFYLLEVFDPALQDMPDDEDAEEDEDASDDGC